MPGRSSSWSRSSSAARWTRHWVAERTEALTRTFPDEDSDGLLQQTSNYTLLAPLRFHLWRQVRLRLESLGHDPPSCMRTGRSALRRRSPRRCLSQNGAPAHP